MKHKLAGQLVSQLYKIPAFLIMWYISNEANLGLATSMLAVLAVYMLLRLSFYVEFKHYFEKTSDINYP